MLKSHTARDPHEGQSPDVHSSWHIVVQPFGCALRGTHSFGDRWCVSFRPLVCPNFVGGFRGRGRGVLGFFLGNILLVVLVVSRRAFRRKRRFVAGASQVAENPFGSGQAGSNGCRRARAWKNRGSWTRHRGSSERNGIGGGFAVPSR